MYIPKSKWIHKWGICQEDANELYDLIIKNKPKIVIETGTFEAHGTYVIANALHENNNNAKIYTIDYDGDPSSNIDKDEWIKLKNIRNDNLNEINRKFVNCEVIFIEGDSRDVLSSIFNKYNENGWDLFYQDSMHFYDGIMSEWNIMKQYANNNSFVIFDDLYLKGVKKFKKWFVKNEKDWNHYISNFKNGHKQLIAFRT